uniref:NADH-ubiquinone oxidoreductase chain 5 n=1 Tax=Gorgonocephalus chilensis TaxID=1258644 RepID=A0A3G2WI42_9ECHI|nr:NADH dehydrogenase subunit 5 [Gorgonocephalus chilensis]AYO99623.1 NADH dehydrogenase subunit 5 [Gorgonocephalus chilensis]
MILSIVILLSFVIFLIFNNNNNNILLIFGVIINVTCAFLWVLLDCPTFIINIKWNITTLQEFNFSFIIDTPFVLFSSVALLVTWSIIEFSRYYIEEDHNKNSFLNTLILFLFFMLLLVSSNNLFLLFIGWEGVGIMSFILIGWWFTRSDANSSALQAIIYNRIGDSGIILFMVISIINFNSWNLNEMIFLNNNSLISSWAIFGIILAAVGKSAQFSLHPWLPSAMEGPTPVSALLHSSTMVVAGVFLLFRCSSLINTYNWALSSISIIGSLTALFAASAALSQYDLKKVIAYSTTSQLGLMTVAIGLNIPNLALFHICTHAFFKSLLFLCSGNIIHSLNNEQDLRKMGNSATYLPLTTNCIIIGSLALSGIPFLAGFYSKDLILEATQNNICNSLSILLSLVATFMTTIYSFRTILFITTPTSNFNAINPFTEENPNSTNPLIRLVLGVILSGWFTSIYFFELQPLIIPLINKIIPLLLTIYAFSLIINNFFWIPSITNIFLTFWNFLSNNWFFVNIFHQNTFFFTFLMSVNGINRALDNGWNTYFLSNWLSPNIIFSSNLIQKIHSAIIANYIIFFITSSFLIILLIKLY